MSIWSIDVLSHQGKVELLLSHPVHYTTYTVVSLPPCCHCLFSVMRSCYGTLVVRVNARLVLRGSRGIAVVIGGTGAIMEFARGETTALEPNCPCWQQDLFPVYYCMYVVW